MNPDWSRIRFSPVEVEHASGRISLISLKEEALGNFSADLVTLDEEREVCTLYINDVDESGMVRYKNLKSMIKARLYPNRTAKFEQGKDVRVRVKRLYDPQSR